MSHLKTGFSLKCLTMWQFVHARWILSMRTREQLLTWQKLQLQRFAAEVMPLAPALAPCAMLPFTEWPAMDKEQMLNNFSGYNTAGISLEQAMTVARQAELSRNFRPTIACNSVGMSSGTSGRPGVFLVSEAERARWAGILLARVMPGKLLRQVLMPWCPPVRIAFFLRANNNLYETLNGRRIRFRFHDLMLGWQAAIPALLTEPPTVLVAPASILRALAAWVSEHGMPVVPKMLISVAEVLEPDDRVFIERVFHQPVQQIYQATEGFLAYTCEQGRLHLNERHVMIEAEWLDNDKRRFIPLITDFSRTTQLLVRYRLDDVLRLADRPCCCGSPDTTLDAIEGRADEILWLLDHQSKWQPVYPELLRRTMMLATPVPQDYRIIQLSDCWQIELAPTDLLISVQGVKQSLNKLCLDQGWLLPALQWSELQPQSPASKRRRIICAQPPSKGNS
jgi:putative adenylate-forming enzyme